MKKIKILLSTIVIISLSGCGGSSDNNVKIETPNNSNQLIEEPVTEKPILPQNNIQKIMNSTTTDNKNLIISNFPEEIKINKDINNIKFIALDNEGNNITDKVKINSNIEKTKEGTYEILFELVNDKNEVVQRVKKYVKVKEDITPVITLNGNKTINLFVGQKFDEPGYKAIDQEDGDITSNVKVSGSVDTNKAGTYVKTYRVTDSFGNVSTETRTVIVKVNAKPVITLNGSNEIVVYVGKSFNEPGFTAKDQEDGDITSKVVITVEKI